MTPWAILIVTAALSFSDGRRLGGAAAGPQHRLGGRDLELRDQRLLRRPRTEVHGQTGRDEVTG